jgi:beta-lactamase superfamily II metal-dependent hydrolase
MNKYFKYTIIVLIIILVIVGFYSFITKYNKMEETDLQIYCFNAGKADACLVSVNGKHIMIDTGEDDLFPEIVQYFNAKKVQELDYLIITHFDKDHVGSAAKIIENYSVKEILQSSFKKENDEYNNYINAIESLGLQPKTIYDDYEFKLGELNVTVNGTKTLFENNESNNSSLITMVNYRNMDFLFMGDAQNARIKEFLEYNTKTYDFIKMPYHGNNMKRVDNLLEEVKPKYAVITSSKKEKEDEETVNMLKNLSIKYYLTREGNVLIKSNGNKIIVEQEG